MLLDLDTDPGTGNLNLRAYVASLVGPRRVTHGARRIYTLSSNKPIMIGENNAPEHECVYLQCWIPASALPGLGGSGALVLFSDSENMGSGLLVDLFTTFPGQPNSHYSAVLLPQDQLFAQISSDASLGPLLSVSLVVSQVTF
jgi:hypothetical protein